MFLNIYVQWPPRFNGVADGQFWRVCVRSFAMPSSTSTSMNAPWEELRLRVGVGSAESRELQLDEQWAWCMVLWHM